MNESTLGADVLCAVGRPLGQVLDDALRELRDQGTTLVAVPSGALSARIKTFRWGDSVLETNMQPGSGVEVTGWSRTRLGRQEREQQADTLKRYPAGALADLTAGS